MTMVSKPGTGRLGVDIGGTFTDLAFIAGCGRITVGKVLTTPANPSRGVRDVIASTIDRNDAASIETFVHGTTLVTNTLIERNGAKTALLTTEGFRDVLEMRREHRFELYDLMVELPRPLVPRHLRFGVPERVLATGEVTVPLDVDLVRRLSNELWDAGVRAVAVCFLHSYRNPEHERLARGAILDATPDMTVSISSDVMPDIREFERTSTVVANAYVQGRTAQYLSEVVEIGVGEGIGPEPLVMLSSGGLATVETAGTHPIRMLESGPAGGAMAAAAAGRALGLEDLMAFDMGGTTAKLCVIVGGRPMVRHDFEIDRVYRMKPGSGLPVNIPVIDMIEIGVGGGSLAEPDALGLLRVGPRSAGAEPGPACYLRGGTRPTVTDADLILGYLSPGSFLGGEMSIDTDAAERAVGDHLATPMGLTAVEAAWGIHLTANQGMANAARVHAIERGKNPSTLPLFAYGGAGPVHATGVAAALGVSRVIVPPRAGVLSALGFLAAPLGFDFVSAGRVALAAVDAPAIERIFRSMEGAGLALLDRAGLQGHDVTIRRIAEMRFEGQGHELPVEIHTDRVDPSALDRVFRERYQAVYGRTPPGLAVEVMRWRSAVVGPAPAWELAADERATGGRTDSARRAFFPETGFIDTPVRARASLEPATSFEGPVLIEEPESTTVVPPSWRGHVDVSGSLFLEAG